MSERPLRDVPSLVVVLFALSLALQIGWHAMRPGPTANARALPPPPSLSLLRVAALGDPITLSKVLMLWLQAFDNQPGVSIPFRDLDYPRVVTWLQRILALDPRARYPLLAAARVYAEVPDPARERRMLDFVYHAFLQDPEHRWRWLAEAAIRAKHRLHDLPLALKYARAITRHATRAPAWARDMSFILLQDMGELQAARLLVGGLIASGRITDPHELSFLDHKLKELERESVEKPSHR
jgi:hypothetical protein